MSTPVQISPYAGELPGPGDLVDVSRLIHAYETDQPDPAQSSERVRFGTSGHRGSSLKRSFNRDHILAISQAICLYRKKKNISGPLFLGIDTHALSVPALRTTLEVLAANEVTALIARNEEFTPTPVISHAILGYNQNRTEGLADGIVLTPSHNPPEEGGFKYNPTHGGPAEKEVTDWIETEANLILDRRLKGIRRISFERAVKSSTTHLYDFLNPYIRDLENVVDIDILRESKIKMAVDPLGGAGVHYWEPIAHHYKLNLTILNKQVDPCFRFMTRDWDGKIRMDPSSEYAMKSVIQKSHDYDITFACDADHDRHGIVTKSAGLMSPNHYLTAAICYLFKNRPLWGPHLKVGKTLVSSKMIDRVAKSLDRPVYEVPVGFKWFVAGLLDGSIGFAGEESAGATFLRKDGNVWTTDKDGFISALLSAEMTARLGRDPAVLYEELTHSLGSSFYERVEAPATASERSKLSRCSAKNISMKTLSGDSIENILTQAPGNQAPIGGIKVETKTGWLALRPSGTEDIYKIYAESFRDEDHLGVLLQDGESLAQDILNAD